MSASLELSPSKADGGSSDDGSGHDMARQTVDVQSDSNSDSISESSDESSDEDVASSKEGTAKNEHDVNNSNPIEEPKLQALAAFGLKEGYRHRFQSYDVVMVHGLCDDRDTVWKGDSNSTTWARSTLGDYLDGCAELYFCYDVRGGSQNCGTIFDVNGIEKVAMCLLNDLVKARETMRRPLKYIARDVGGLIVKMALILARRAPSQYHGIAEDTSAVIFHNCPAISDSIDGLEDVFLRIMSLPGSRVTRYFSRKALRLAAESYTINNDFNDINMSAQARIWNLVSTKQTSDIENNSGTGYPLDDVQGLTTHPLEGQYKTSISHTELVGLRDKGEKNDIGDERGDSGVENLREHCSAYFRDMADEEVSEEKLLGPEVNAVQDSTLGRQIILSLCPPIRSPPLVTSISSDPFWSWLSDKDAFKAWIDSATRGTRILHLQGNVSNVAYFSNQVFSGLYEDLTSRGRQTPIFHFRFHRHDCRYNNTQALMTSFLAQLVSRSSAFAIRKVARIANFIRREQALCLTDLIQLFEDMRQTDECEGFYWMISCIEECVDQGLGQVFRAFRQRSITNEQTFKVIVTGRDNDNGKNLEGFPLIDLDSFPSTAYYRAAHNARYGATQEALVGLAETQTEFEDDVPLKAMATEWLEARRVGLASNQNALTLLPESANLSQTAIFRILAEPVPPSLQDLRATAISLVRYAIRPLTVQELASALAMNEMAGSRQAGEGVAFSWTVQRLTQSFQEMVPGQFVVKHNEVHFAHGDSAEDASDTTFAESHRDIVKRCLQYLNLPSSISEMKQFVCELYDTEIPVTPTRNSFTAYAVQYFPHHYKRSGLARPLEDVFGFFHDRGNMLSWSEAHYALANVSTRVHCGYSSMLPILSRTGLLDLVEEYLRRESGSKEYDSTKHRADWSLAIIEACRLGDVPLVRFLIKVSRPNATELSTAIIAAVSNGDSELIEYLIDEISALKGLDQWPEDEGWADDTLFRVAWLGQQEAVKKLIALDININPKPESMRFEGPPLFISIRGKSQAVVEMLLAAGADTTITAPWGDERALTKAARWGEPEFVDILLHHEPAKARERGELNEALQLACEFAAFASMRTLLEAGADPNMKAWEDDEGFETPLFCCASHGYVQCVQILLQHKADVNFTVPNSTALLQAVHNDLIELARMLLIHGAEPNLTTELIELPLIIAADRDNVAMVELLLDHHADIEKESETNDLPNTPLAVAARYSGMEVIRCLMRRGADINHVGKRSCSPFWSACWRKPPQLELVKELLEAGADINAPSGDPTVLNWSPIHAAYDFPEILATLLGAGAKINQISADSSTVLYLASKWNHQDSVHTLLAYKGKDEIEIDREIFDEPDTEHGMTPLCIACQKGHVGIMRLLLEAGANPAHRMPTGGFPLLLCLEADVDGKDIEHTVRMLLEYLPCDKLNQRDNDGNTALHTIRAAHQVPVVRCLVNMGADMSAQNNKGFTPFQRAIHVDNPEVAAYLLSKGADIHADSSGTGSPLRLACRAASLRMMKLLIEAGAEVNEQDKTTGESILQTCIVDGSRDKVELVQYLVEDRKVDVNVGGGHFKYPIINNARTDYIDSDIVATLLVHNGADVNAKDDAGRRVIHHSMLQETHFLTEELLGLGAEIEALDALGRNALHYAAASGNVHLVGRILASDHISVDLADGDGWTPLMWACRGRKEHSFDTICGMLLGRGASPWARGSGQYDEWSPLKTARYFNRASKSADSIMAQLEPSGEQRKIEEGFEVWNDDFHRTRKGWDEETPLCSGCFSVCYGIRWRCEAESKCPDFYLCFVCYMHRDVLHPQQGHSLREIGKTYASDSESPDGSRPDDDASSQGSDRDTCESSDTADETSDVA